MKRDKLRRLVAEVLNERDLIEEPVTFDVLSIDFDARTFTVRGRTVQAESRIVVLPLLSTDRVIIPRDGSGVA
jgi:hypothetical protein